MLQSLKGPSEKGRFQRVAWTDLNRTLISAGEDGCVRRWDVEVRSRARLGPTASCVTLVSPAQHCSGEDGPPAHGPFSDLGPVLPNSPESMAPCGSACCQPAAHLASHKPHTGGSQKRLPAERKHCIALSGLSAMKFLCKLQLGDCVDG